MSGLLRSRHASSGSHDLQAACPTGHPSELGGQTLEPAHEGLQACRAEGSHDSQSLHLLPTRHSHLIQNTWYIFIKNNAVPLHAMEALGGSRGGIAPTYSWPQHYMGVSGQHHAWAVLYPRGKDPGTHWIGGWVGHRASLDTQPRVRILCPYQESNPGRPVHSQTLYCLSYTSSLCIYKHCHIYFHEFSRRTISPPKIQQGNS
jgi:hypothetical protein